MNKEEITARPYEEYYEMIQDMSKDSMIQGLYDLSKECIVKQNKINQLEEELIKKTKRCTERNHRIRCRDRKLERRNKKINKLETNIEEAIRYIKAYKPSDAEFNAKELLSILERGKE